MKCWRMVPAGRMVPTTEGDRPLTGGWPALSPHTQLKDALCIQFPKSVSIQVNSITICIDHNSIYRGDSLGPSSPAAPRSRKRRTGETLPRGGRCAGSNSLSSHPSGPGFSSPSSPAAPRSQKRRTGGTKQTAKRIICADCHWCSLSLVYMHCA